MLPNVIKHIRAIIFFRFLTPLVALTLYLGLSSWFLSWLFPGEPANVTSVFISRAWKLAVALTVVSHLACVVRFRWVRRPEPAFRESARALTLGDGFLILLPLAPVVQYIVNNLNILSLAASLFVLVVFAAFSTLFILAVPAAMGRFGPVRPLVFLGLAFTFTVANMAALSASRHWFAAGNFGLQLAVFGGVFLSGFLLNDRVGRRSVYFIVVLYFTANTATQLITASQKEAVSIRTDTTSKLINRVGSRKPLTRPNIYLLIYDAYVANETMLGYGIDNSDQEGYLADQGFSLYPATYSVAGFSVGTMSRVLNASGDFFGEPRSAVSGNGIVPNLLRSFGYESHGIFSNDYFFQTTGANYDHSYPRLTGTHLMLTKAIFMGEFRFDVEFDSPSREDYVTAKAKTLGHVPDRPRFIYMHDELPGHSQNSGKCRPDETELFAERLELANQEMKRNLAAIREHDPDALVVVAGDHGPYLTKNCYVTGDEYELAEITRLDIQDRYGTFLAIKWPSGTPPVYDDIVVLQDLFPVIFAYLFDDPALLSVREKPSTRRPRSVSGATVLRGVIRGGVNDGEALFLGPARQP